MNQQQLTKIHKFIIVHVQIFRGPLRPDYGCIELVANEICAICEDKFADENELKGHVNKIHLLSTGPKRPSRSAPPPKKLANQVLDGYDGLDRHYFIRKETKTQEAFELLLKKEGKMLTEIGFEVCGHRICMIKAPNVCGICGRKYKTEKRTATYVSKYVESDSEYVSIYQNEKPAAKKSTLKKKTAKKSKYIESDTESNEESDEESFEDSEEDEPEYVPKKGKRGAPSARNSVLAKKSKDTEKSKMVKKPESDEESDKESEKEFPKNQKLRAPAVRSAILAKKSKVIKSSSKKMTVKKSDSVKSDSESEEESKEESDKESEEEYVPIKVKRGPYRPRAARSAIPTK